MNYALFVVYDDAYIICVNKPPGMLSVPGKSCVIKRAQSCDRTIDSSQVSREDSTATEGKPTKKRSYESLFRPDQAVLDTVDGHSFLRRDEQWAKAILQAAPVSINGQKDSPYTGHLSELSSLDEQDHIRVTRRAKVTENDMDKDCNPVDVLLTKLASG